MTSELRRRMAVVDLPRLTVDYAMAFAYAGKGLAGRVTGTAPRNPEGTPKVLVLTGVWEPYLYISPILDTLRAAGFETYKVPRISLNLEDVSVLAERVSTYIEDDDLRDVVLVAHSKGGLVAKQLLLEDSVKDRILGVVALCTPFEGSELADVAGVLPGVESLQTDSPMVQKLDEKRHVNSKIVAIYPEYDPVIPVRGDNLDGATNVEVPGFGHFRMLSWPHAMREVVKAVSRFHGLPEDGVPGANDNGPHRQHERRRRRYGRRQKQRGQR